MKKGDMFLTGLHSWGRIEQFYFKIHYKYNSSFIKTTKPQLISFWYGLPMTTLTISWITLCFTQNNQAYYSFFITWYCPVPYL